MYVVDDGSDDATGECFAGIEGVRVLRNDGPHGFGASVKHGLRAVLGATVSGSSDASHPSSASGASTPLELYVGWLPGNLRVQPLSALVVARELHRRHRYGSAFAKAHRTNRPFLDRVKSALTSFALSVSSASFVREFGGTPTVVPASSASLVLDGPDDLSFELYTLWRLRRNGLCACRPSVPFGPRVYGSSKWNSGFGAQMALLVAMRRALGSFRSRRHR